MMPGTARPLTENPPPSKLNPETLPGVTADIRQRAGQIIMNCILTESALLGALTASQLEDIRKQAPAGEDPVTESILSACAKVDAYCQGRTVPGPLMGGWARDICVFYLAKILNKSTEDQRTAYDNALKELQDVRSGTFRFPPDSTTSPRGPLAYGSKKKII